MHFLFLSQFYTTPDCPAAARHYAFLEALGRRHEVSLITSRTWLDTRLTDRFALIPPGVRLLVVDTTYRNQMHALRRVVPYVQYAAEGLFRSVRLPRPDAIFASNTPLSVAMAGAAVARLRGVPWVLEVQDLWPDFPVQMGAVGPAWLRRALYGVERKLYRRAAHVVATSPDMARHVEGHGVPPARVSTLLYGTDLALAQDPAFDVTESLRERYGLHGVQVLLYAGAFGRANDIPTLIETARRLQHRTDLVFVFVGQGYYDEALAQAAAGLPNLRLIAPEPRHRIFSWFRLAALSLVSFLDLPVLSANSPAKFFDSLAAGTPVVVTNPGWTKAFVETHGCGWYVPPSRPDALAARLTSLLAQPDVLREAGARGARVAAETFDRAQMAGRLDHILTSVAAGRPPEPDASA